MYYEFRFDGSSTPPSYVTADNVTGIVTIGGGTPVGTVIKVELLPYHDPYLGLTDQDLTAMILVGKKAPVLLEPPDVLYIVKTYHPLLISIPAAVDADGD